MGWTAGDRCGRYELLRPLGRGGAGVVWEAMLRGPSGFRKTVALKLLREGARTDEARASLRTEARIGARVTHPNIASTWELGEEARAPFLAMELVRGATVAAMLRRGPMPPRAILDVGVQVCAGLRHLHTFATGPGTRGLVHRDVKPSNLLVDHHGCVKIADLGIVTQVGPQAQVFRTPGFAAPEQIASSRAHRGRPRQLGHIKERAAGGDQVLRALHRVPAPVRDRADAPDPRHPSQEDDGDARSLPGPT